MINNLNELIRNDKLTIRKIGDQFYLLCSGKCYEVNNIGATIVNQIEKNMPISVLTEKLSQKYKFLDLIQIEKDIYSFLDFLFKEGLLKNDK